MRLARKDQIKAHLVHTDGPGGYRMSTLVRDYAVELAEAPTPLVLHPLPGWRLDPVASAPTRNQRKGHPA